MAYSAGRNKYAEKNKDELNKLIRRLNRVPKDILYAAVSEAFTTAVTETKQDSGNAAWHWTITGLRQRETGANSKLDFDVKYGQTPIGQRGDHGGNSVAVLASTIEDGLAILRTMIYDKNRKGVVIFHGLDDSDYAARANITGASLEITKAALEGARMAAAKAKYQANNNY